MVIDAGKYYTIIHAVKGQERYGREEEYLMENVWSTSATRY